MEERIYTINLKRETLKTSRDKKSKKAVRVVKNYLKKHMKSDQIKLDKSITEKIWEGGNQKPPAKIRIKATKDDDNIVKAEVWGPMMKKQVTEEKTEKPEEKEPEKKETKEKKIESTKK